MDISGLLEALRGSEAPPVLSPQAMKALERQADPYNPASIPGLLSDADRGSLQLEEEFTPEPNDQSFMALSAAQPPVTVEAAPAEPESLPESPPLSPSFERFDAWIAESKAEEASLPVIVADIVSKPEAKGAIPSETTPKKRRVYTAEERAQALEAVEHGHSYRQAAETIGCHPSTVGRWARNAGISRRRLNTSSIPSEVEVLRARVEALEALVFKHILGFQVPANGAEGNSSPSALPPVYEFDIPKELEYELAPRSARDRKHNDQREEGERGAGLWALEPESAEGEERALAS